jgi:dephospho-CoA kinase
MQSDQVDADSARKILAAQAPRAARLDIADDVIVNDGHPEHLVAAVDELHRLYIQLSVYDSEPAPSQ